MGVLVTKRAGVGQPAAFVELALLHCTGGVAVACATDGQIDISAGAVDADEFKKSITSDAVKERALVQYFWDAGTYSESSIQPFICLADGEDKPHIVMFAEGEFAQYAHAESNHSNQFFLFSETVQPLIARLCAETDGDLDKMMEALQSGPNARELSNACLPRGHITFLCSTGRILQASVNPDKREFPWGWCSRSFGYEQGATAPAAQPAKAKATGFKIPGFGKTQAPTVLPDLPSQPPSAPAATPAASPPANPPAQSQPAAAAMPKFKVPGATTQTAPAAATATVTVGSGQENELVRCPEDLMQHGKNAVKNWYIKNCGRPPQNWKERPAMPRMKEPVKTFSDPQIAALAEAQDKRVAAAKETPAVVQEAVEEGVPIISALVKQAIHEDFLGRDSVKKVLDRQSNEVIDPALIQSLDSNKYPSACADAGITLAQTYRIEYADLQYAARKYPDWIAKLLMDYRAALIHRLKPEEKPQPVAAPAASAMPKFRVPGAERKAM